MTTIAARLPVVPVTGGGAVQRLSGDRYLIAPALACVQQVLEEEPTKFRTPNLSPFPNHSIIIIFLI